MTPDLGCPECRRTARPIKEELPVASIFSTHGAFPHRQSLLWRCRFCRTWWEVPATAPSCPVSNEEVITWFDVGDFVPSESDDPQR